MEFNFSISDVLSHDIVCVDGSMIPSGFHPTDETSAGECQKKVAYILDKIGVSSGIAQGLQSPVTSADRLKNSDHRVYIMSDASAGQSGKVIGLLKVGHKKLYVFDQVGRHNELTPLCVLDFYVHESVQRRGCGRTLYEFMLNAENVKAEHLALDRPSEKLLSFLAKHYDFQNIIPQSNNFVVYDKFFNSRPDQMPGFAKHIPMDYGYKAAAGCNSVRYAPASGRALVAHHDSSMGRMFTSNGSNGDHVDSYSHSDGHSEVSKSPPPPVSPTHTHCSAEVEANVEAPHKDIKFQHHRLW